MSHRRTEAILQPIAETLRRKAIQYDRRFQGQPIEVRLVRHKVRPMTVLAEWEIRSAQSRRTWITKSNRPLPGEPTHREPSESYVIPASDRPGAEWSAMRRLQQRYSDGQHWYAVNVLDSILDDRVLVMEKSGAATLAASLRRSAIRSRRYQRYVLRAVENSGLWLRDFHSMATDPFSKARGCTRSDFRSWTDLICDRLIESDADTPLIKTLRARLVNAAEQHLPSQLPTCSLHDDFAPRNILLDDAARIAVIDLTLEWKGCIWEDLSRFVATTYLDKVRIYSGGAILSAAWLERIEEAFYEAYFGSENIPWRPLRLYQAQIALTSLAANPITKPRSSVRGMLQRRVARHALAFAHDRLERIRRARILRMPTMYPLETLGGRG